MALSSCYNVLKVTKVRDLPATLSSTSRRAQSWSSPTSSPYPRSAATTSTSSMPPPAITDPNRRSPLSGLENFYVDGSRHKGSSTTPLFLLPTAEIN